MKALATELDSMASLLEVLHQNSISLRDPQAISEELDTIVRQSEDSERVVREMEALLRGDGDAWSADVADADAGRRAVQGAADPDAAAPESEGPVSDAVRTLPALGADAGARHPRPPRQHLHPARQHARPGAAAADRPGGAARGFVPLTTFLGRLDVRPARRGDRVPARQRRDLSHPRIAQALHRRGGRGRRGARHRPGAIAAARSGGVLLAARFVPEAGGPPRNSRSASR